MRDDALERRRREQQKHYAAVSAEACAVCKEAIPEARRQALPGVQTCVDCQNELERALAGGGSHQGF